MITIKIAFVADTRIETRVIVINLRACMYSNPRTVIVENAPNIFNRNISVYSQLSQHILKKINILFQCKERPAKTKLIPAKLRAVLAGAKSDSAKCSSMLDFRKNLKIKKIYGV